MTNVVLTPNQTRTTCPEDPGELPKIICGYRNTTTGEVNITQGICVKVRLKFHSRPENLKKSRPKKLVKANKAILRKIFLAKFHFFVISKITKNQFLNWEKV